MTNKLVKSIFLNDAMFRRFYPEQGGWYDTHGGGPIVHQGAASQDRAGEAHRDEFLSVLAECQIGLYEPVMAGGSTFTVADLVRRSTERFSRNNRSEFTAVALSCYIAESGGFTTKLDDWIALEAILELLTSEDAGRGPCYGTHSCYAVAAMLNLNEAARFLSDSSVKRANEFLDHAAAMLEQSQHADGAWRIDWPSGVTCKPPALSADDWGDAVAVTGHHLEWMALVRRQVLPKVSLARAIAFTATAIRRASRPEIRAAYAPWSHAMRALLMWKDRCQTGRSSVSK